MKNLKKLQQRDDPVPATPGAGITTDIEEFDVSCITGLYKPLLWPDVWVHFVANVRAALDGLFLEVCHDVVLFTNTFRERG